MLKQKQKFLKRYNREYQLEHLKTSLFYRFITHHNFIAATVIILVIWTIAVVAGESDYKMHLAGIF